MSMPRYVDRLLEECGSRRFYARGERGEPHAPTNSDEVRIKEWTNGMCEAVAASWGVGEGVGEGEGDPADAHDGARAQGRGSPRPGRPPVAWDALWEYQPSQHHHDVKEWSLEELVRETRRYELPGGPSSLARAGPEHALMLKRAQEDEEEKIRLYRERMQERMRKRVQKPAGIKAKRNSAVWARELARKSD